jgi:hypothetical protein
MGANHLPLQSIQDDYRLKVKFAIADPHDLQQYRGEAYTEYMGFFQDPANFPSKWLVGEGGT